MLFGEGLNKFFCKHKGSHEEWGYRFGSGIAELYCSKCGKTVKRIPLDDLPKETLQRLIELLREAEGDQDQEPGSEE